MKAQRRRPAPTHSQSSQQQHEVSQVEGGPTQQPRFTLAPHAHDGFAGPVPAQLIHVEEDGGGFFFQPRTGRLRLREVGWHPGIFATRRERSPDKTAHHSFSAAQCA